MIYFGHRMMMRVDNMLKDMNVNLEISICKTTIQNKSQKAIKNF